MRLTLRFYKRYEPGLLALVYCSSDIQETIKNLIRAYINDIPVSMPLPDTECHPMVTLPAKLSFHVNLDPESDADIIGFISGIKIGRRNNLIKKLVENSFPVILAPYFTDSEFKPFKLNDVGEEVEESEL